MSKPPHLPNLKIDVEVCPRVVLWSLTVSSRRGGGRELRLKQFVFFEWKGSHVWFSYLFMSCACLFMSFRNLFMHTWFVCLSFELILDM